MSVWLATIAPALAGLFYLALGLTALARPANLLAGFGVAAEGVDPRNEVRAVYGGFPLAVAGLVACSLSGAHADQSKFILCGRSMCGFCDARLSRRGLLAGLAAVSLTGCSENAATGRRQLVLVSDSQLA